MSFDLRSCQEPFVHDIREQLLAGKKSVLAQAPTGFGKTVIASFMLGTAAERGINGVFFVHRRELVKQSIKAFDRAGIPHGVIASGFQENRSARVQIASINTYKHRYDRFAKPGLALWDECHHVAAESWSTMFSGMQKTTHIGFTATPERLDGAGLGSYFEAMVQGPTVAQLISDGWLTPYKLYVPPGISIEGIHSKMGDYVRSEIASAADKPTITGNVIKEYRRRCDGGRAVVFCATIEHSLHVAEQFRAAGIPAAHVDGETPNDERDSVLERFEDNDIRVVCNVELFGEGFDLPALDCVIGQRPTQSLALALQQWGRALRPIYAEGYDLSTKEGRLAAIAAGPKPYAVLIDQAGNCERHQLPDTERVWSLAGKSGSPSPSGSGYSPIKRCRFCSTMQPRAVDVCKSCGNSFPSNTVEIEVVDGDLVEVDASAVRRSWVVERKEANSLEKLIELGRRKGYKDPRGWATHVHNARLRKNKELSFGF